MFKILFIILVAIVAINSILATIKWKEISIVRKLWTIASIVVVLFTAYYTWTDFTESNKTKSIGSNIGKLQTDIYKKGNKIIKFEIGGGHIEQSTDGNFKLPQITEGKDPSKGEFFTTWINNDKLFLNIVIRNEIGEIIATIEGQTWKVYNTEYDYNNDDKGFEIVTPDKRVIFQIFLKEELVFVRGLVLSDKKVGYYIREEPNGIGGILIVVNLNLRKWEVPNVVPKIFKYPRETYFGVRDFNNPLNNK